MLWGIESQVLTPWYKKDCCSLILFVNGIVNTREVEQRVGWECLTLDFVKYWLRLHGCCLWYKLYIFFQLHIGEVCSVRPVGWFMTRFALKFGFVW